MPALSCWYEQDVHNLRLAVAMLPSVGIVILALLARYKLADSPLSEQLGQSVKRLQTIQWNFSL